MARSLVRALEDERARLVVRGTAWLVHHLDHVAPALLDRLPARTRRRRSTAAR